MTSQSEEPMIGRIGSYEPTGLSSATPIEPQASRPKASIPCVEANRLIDTSFTGLLARQRTLFERQTAEVGRLQEALTTIRINAMRSTPQTRAAFVSFCDMGLREVLAGSTVHEAFRIWDDYQKCSSCGAAAGVLGNGKCFECTPDGKWPLTSDSDGSGEAVETAQTGSTEGDSAGLKGIAKPSPEPSPHLLGGK